MDILSPVIGEYLLKLAGHSHPVLLKLEKLARERGFPIIGPEAGRLIHILVRLQKPREVFELGSGFGYSALWAATALENGARIHLTDDSHELIEAARENFREAGLLEKAVFHEMDALQAYRKYGHNSSFVLVDMYKQLYPEAFRVIREILPVGGVVIADNLLWNGKVLSENRDSETDGIIEFTRMLWSDRDFTPVLLPVRDGIGIAVRISR